MNSPDGIPVDPTSKRQRLGRIVDHPQNWKVCEGCESVVAKVRDFCPKCHAYRFDETAKRVKAAAKKAARRAGDDLPIL